MRENHSEKTDQTPSLPQGLSIELRKAYRASRKDPGQLEAKEWDLPFVNNENNRIKKDMEDVQDDE